MTKKLIIISLFAIALFSCKDKEAEKLKKEQQKLEHQKAKVENLNKNFIYSCIIIASKTELPLENVQLVLKKYFEDKKYFVFKPNSFVVLNDDNWEHKRKHNLDLIEETSKKYAIPFNDVVKIYSALGISERLDDLKDQMYSLKNRIEDLEGKIDKTD